MKSRLLLPLFLLSSLYTLPQSISGKVKDSNGQVLPFANVLLLNSKDSTLIKGAASDETGNYRIDHVPSGTYLLAATMVGYTMAYASPVTINKLHAEVKVPVLILSSDVIHLNELTYESIRRKLKSLQR